jgi:hypothetical protein
MMTEPVTVAETYNPDILVNRMDCLIRIVSQINSTDKKAEVDLLHQAATLLLGSCELQSVEATPFRPTLVD